MPSFMDFTCCSDVVWATVSNLLSSKRLHAVGNVHLATGVKTIKIIRLIWAILVNYSIEGPHNVIEVQPTSMN